MSCLRSNRLDAAAVAGHGYQAPYLFGFRHRYLRHWVNPGWMVGRCYSSKYTTYMRSFKAFRQAYRTSILYEQIRGPYSTLILYQMRRFSISAVWVWSLSTFLCPQRYNIIS
jgi:hypothetical protein